MFVYNAKDLHIVMPMHSLLEYSDNFSMTSESLRNYHRDKINVDENENNNNSNKINRNKTTTSNLLSIRQK